MVRATNIFFTSDVIVFTRISKDEIETLYWEWQVNRIVEDRGKIV